MTIMLLLLLMMMMMMIVEVMVNPKVHEPAAVQMACLLALRADR